MLEPSQVKDALLAFRVELGRNELKRLLLTLDSNVDGLVPVEDFEKLIKRALASGRRARRQPIRCLRETHTKPTERRCHATEDEPQQRRVSSVFEDDAPSLMDPSSPMHRGTNGVNGASVPWSPIPRPNTASGLPPLVRAVVSCCLCPPPSLRHSHAYIPSRHSRVHALPWALELELVPARVLVLQQLRGDADVPPGQHTAGERDLRCPLRAVPPPARGSG